MPRAGKQEHCSGHFNCYCVHNCTNCMNCIYKVIGKNARDSHSGTGCTCIGHLWRDLLYLNWLPWETLHMPWQPWTTIQSLARPAVLAMATYTYCKIFGTLGKTYYTSLGYLGQLCMCLATMGNTLL
jgi:hypothetical protein